MLTRLLPASYGLHFLIIPYLAQRQSNQNNRHSLARRDLQNAVVIRHPHWGLVVMTVPDSTEFR